MNRSSGLLSPRGQVLMFAALALLAFTAFPFAWMASTALKPSHEIFVTPPTLWPTHVTLDNLSRLFAETRFLTYFRNSLTVSFATVGLTLLVSVPAAYGLTRFRFHGRETVAGLILFTYMFAPIMIIIPFYVAMRFLGLANTHLGLILAYTAFCLPFSLWLLRTFFQSIPLETKRRLGSTAAVCRRLSMSSCRSHCPAWSRPAPSPSFLPGTTTSSRACCLAPMR